MGAHTSEPLKGGKGPYQGPMKLPLERACCSMSKRTWDPVFCMACGSREEREQSVSHVHSRISDPQTTKWVAWMFRVLGFGVLGFWDFGIFGRRA